MSASNSRVRDSIRRIALSDPDIRALLDDFKNRGGIASDSIDIEGAADDRAICCDGSTSSGTPGSSTRDPDADGAGQDASDGLNSDDPANLDMGGGSLAGVQDCSTGEPICFAGSDWVPPDGWESPSETPAKEGYEEGVFYAWWDFNFGYACDSVSATRPDDPYGSPAFGFWRTEYCPPRQAFLSDCPNSTESACSPDFCETHDCQWPEDGCVNLANKGGKFVASKYDPEASGSSYLKGVSEVELCDDYGNSFKLRASGSSPGGWKTIDPSSPGDGYLYDANGTQIARISGSEYSDPAI